jgi:hypothetical protein
MNRRSQNRLAILRRYLDAWAALPRHNRGLVAEIIVEKFDEMGLADHIAGTGVEFSSTDDLSHDMRARGQKIWRWLGAFEEVRNQPGKLFFVEQAIVAAMPNEIKTAYLSEAFLAADVCIVEHKDSDKINPKRIARALIKENSEAQAAVVDLHEDSTEEEIDSALQELKESEAATRSAITAIKKHKGEK